MSLQQVITPLILDGAVTSPKISMPLSQNLTVSANNAYDIGDGGNGWKNLFLAGTIRAGNMILASNLDMNGQQVVNTYAFVQNGANPADQLTLRLRKDGGIAWRNNANTQNNTLTVDTSDRLVYNNPAGMVFGTNATPPLIHPIAAQTNSVVVDSPANQAFLSSKLGSILGGNAYYDGTNWQRYDVAQSAMAVICGGSGTTIYGAPAGANPIVWNPVYFVLGPTGNLTLPNGSITTPMIANNAVQQLVTSYFGQPNQTIAATGGWVATAIAVAGVVSGGTTTFRFEYNVEFSAANANTPVQLCIGFDGTPTYIVAAVHTGIANANTTLGGTIYYNLPSGTHSATMYLLWGAGNILVGQTGLCYCWLYVTEQKR